VGVVCKGLLLVALLSAMPLAAQESSPKEASPPASAPAAAEPVRDAVAGTPDPVEVMVERVRPSTVTVTVSGRDGRQQGMGTGFVISRDGLIATNLHVIDEARPVSVKFADGKTFEVTEIHATDKTMDLAVLRIDAHDLPALELGNSDALKPGQEVIAIGNPLGLERSVVRGVVSELREIEGRPMIQLAIPIERGNSGGPLLDRQGRVQGIVTLKSLVTRDLGFAVVVNALKPLLDKPNPIAMSRWTTIGALDERDWKPLLGARWRQRAGRILVDDTGGGFGGRSLCLSARDVPALPYEVAVQVRFTPENGAAGLVFHCDGQNRHYGFYPSNGSLRLARFDGPDVYSWNVLDQVSSDAYRPGDWNSIRVRVEPGRLLCYINDELAIESTDSEFTSGAVGLAKFRDTDAEFRYFRVGQENPAEAVPPEVVERIAALSRDLTPQSAKSPDLIEQLLSSEDGTTELLRREARLLEQRAAHMRTLAGELHARRVQQQLGQEFERPEDKVDLLRVALLIARLDNEEVDVDGYSRVVERTVERIRATLPADASESDRLAALDSHLFDSLGFHGSRSAYYHRSNSYLNEVIDDREGLPITLSLLYMELARRLDLKVVGVGLPGHFVVRFEPTEGESRLIDVFDRARVMTRDEAIAQVRLNLADRVDDSKLNELIDQFLAATPPRSIAVRILSNLRGVAEGESDHAAVLRYLNAALEIDPGHLETRARRIDVEIRTGRVADAITDIDWMLEHNPEGMDVPTVTRLRDQLRQRLQSESM